MAKVLELQRQHPLNIQGWFPLGLIGLISLKSKGLSSVFANTTIRKHQFFSTQPSLWSRSYIHTWLLEKPYLCQPSNVSVFFNMLLMFVIAFLPRSKHLLISWLQPSSTVILEPPKIKSVTVSIVSPSTCYEVMGLEAMIFVFWM